ncbi:MAG: hypothetical protein R3E50_15995 [Halioglobus sp.]
MFSPAMRRELQGYRALETFDYYARRSPTDDPLAHSVPGHETYLVGDILTKVDRASMGSLAGGARPCWTTSPRNGCRACRWT